MDVSAFVSALTVGASAVGPHAASALGRIVGTEVVKEATKDGYKSLKQAVGHVLGSKGRRAAERLEADPTSAEAQDTMAKALSDIADEDLPELEETLKRFLAVLSQDRVALAAGEAAASIDLDVDSGGNVGIHRITGARTIAVKSRSDGDFDFSDVSLKDGSTQPGN